MYTQAQCRAGSEVMIFFFGSSLLDADVSVASLFRVGSACVTYEIYTRNLLHAHCLCSSGPTTLYTYTFTHTHTHTHTHTRTHTLTHTHTVSLGSCDDSE